MTRTFSRWIVPASVAVAVLGVAAVGTAWRASADPQLPERSAAQLLVDVQTARLEGLSGTVVQRADLGLPLPIPAAGSGGASLAGLINGSHTLRVWYSGPDKTRVAILSTLGETDIIRNGRDVWRWSSTDQTATHSVLPESAARAGINGQIIDPANLPATPQELADMLLGYLDESTEVTTSGTTKIAGRSAYELVLAPRDEASLVSQVRLAIDGEKHLPLRVQLLVKGGGNPAFEIGFTQVSFDRPGNEHFQFTPPAGTQVIEEGGSKPDGAAEGKPDAKPMTEEEKKALAERLRQAKPGDVTGKPAEGAPDDGSHSKVLGSSWTTVLMTRTPTAGSGDRPFEAFLSALPQASGSWGTGRVLRSRVVTVLLTDDGRMFVGAVKAERLFELATANK